MFINASEHFEKNKRQNTLSQLHIQDIVNTYKHREDRERYSRKVSMEEIEKNDFNLNISRYVSTALPEPEIDLREVNRELALVNEAIKENTARHNEFLRELGLEEI